MNGKVSIVLYRILKRDYAKSLVFSLISIQLVLVSSVRPKKSLYIKIALMQLLFCFPNWLYSTWSQ